MEGTGPAGEDLGARELRELCDGVSGGSPRGKAIKHVAKEVSFACFKPR